MENNNNKLSFNRVVFSGDIVEIYNYQRPYVYNRVEKERYIEKAPQTKRRDDNLAVLQRYLRRVIFTNVNSWGNNVAFVTFTFAENISDLDVANKMWGQFIRKLKKETNKSLKYTCVIEFQKRGAVHYHVLFYNLPSSWVKNERRDRKIAKLWGKGFVDVKTIKQVRSIRSIGAYVSKYLSKESLDARLVGQKSYFSSRGLKKPLEIRDTKRAYQAMKEKTLDTKYKMVYNSNYISRSYGIITYKQYIKQKNYASLSN